MGEMLGNATINPVLFATGKIAGYVCWAISVLRIFQVGEPRIGPEIEIAAYSIFFIGVLVAILSIVDLGNSTRLGLPSGKTVLKTGGLYGYSRNPMYIGFGLLSASAVLLSFNPLVFILGAYSTLIYHIIILGEEKFLSGRFGKKYSEYCKKVRRYI